MTISNALGGIGEGLIGYEQGRLMKQRQDRADQFEDEDRAMARTKFDQEQTKFNQSQQDQAGAAQGASYKMRQTADRGFQAIDQLWAFQKSLDGKPTPSTPGATAPAASGKQGLVAPGFSAKVGATQTGAPGAPSQDQQQPQEDMPDDLKELKGRYSSWEAEVADADKKLRKYVNDNYGGDPQALERMENAWWKANEGKGKELEEAAAAYHDRIQKAYTTKQANAFVDSVGKNDTEAIEGMFGQGAKPGTDPRTGLQGVMLPSTGKDAKGRPIPGQFVGQEVVMARAMLRAGLITDKDYTAAADAEAKNITELMKQREESRSKISVASIEHQSAVVQEANEIYKTTLAETHDEGKARQAKLDRLKVAERDAATREANEKDKDYRAKEDRLDKEVQSAHKDDVAWVKDPDTDEYKLVGKVKPEQAVERFKQFYEKDPTGKKAMQYASGLTPEQNAAIQKFIKEKADKEAAAPKQPIDVTKPGSSGVNAKGVKVWNDGGTLKAWSKAKNDWVVVPK